MATKSVRQSDYDELVKRVGKPFADNIVNHLETQGKDLEGKGVAFKMPNMPTDEDEDKADDKPEDEEDEMDKSLNLSEKDFILFAGMKQMGDFIQAMHKTQDELRKQVKDLNNQLEQMKTGQGDVLDTMRRQTQYFGKLTQQTPASKSSQSQYSGGDETIDDPVKKNHENQDAPVPVFTQMKSNVGINVPDMPFQSPNGDK